MNKWQSMIQSPEYKRSRLIGHLLLVCLPSLAAVLVYSFLPGHGSALEKRLEPFLFWSLSVLTASQLLVVLYQFLRKKGLPALSHAIVALFCVAWMMLFVLSHSTGFYIQAEDAMLYVCGLVCIPVFYSMLSLINRLLPISDGKLKGGLMPLLLTPLCWYMLVNSVMLSARGAIAVIVLLLTITATYFFVFLLFYLLWIVAQNHAGLWKVLRFLLVFVLPVLCFAVTQIGDTFGFFWDYTALFYYALVAVNGTLLYLPEPNKMPLRLLLFFSRCAMYLVVTYFFVVIAPFYSLSLVGLLLAGLGLLVLTPLFLWVYQTKTLFHSAKALWRDCGKVQTIAALLVGFTMAPLVMTGAFMLERLNLETAVAHIKSLNSQPNSSIAEPVQVDGDKLSESMRYMLSEQKMSLPSYSSFANGEYRYYSGSLRVPPPFITFFHNKLMGTGEFLVAAEQNQYLLNDLEALYVNKEPEQVSEDMEYYNYSDPEDESEDLNDGLIPDEWLEYEEEGELPPVLLEEIKIETRWEGDSYRSFVHLTLTDTRGGANRIEDTLVDEPVDELPADPMEPAIPYYGEFDDSLVEYSTHVSLPEGVFVSDYYLDVTGTRKQGILAETSSANWIYDTVTSRFLDPGLVQYAGDGISLKVFPFKPNETRYTGIEFLHKESVLLLIDDKEVVLAPQASALTQPVEGENLVFISEAAKSVLPDAQRQPYYLFAVDCSYQSDVEALAARLEAFVAAQQIPAEQAAVTAINYNRQTWTLTEDWKNGLLGFPREGGFGYGMMVDQMFMEIDPERYYPVLLILKTPGSRAIAPRNWDFLMQYSPETAGMFTVGENGIYYEAYYANIFLKLKNLPEARPVKALDRNGGRIYLPADTGAQIYYNGTYDAIVSAPTGSPWQDALNFNGDAFRMSKINDSEARFAMMLDVIKKSFAAHVMSPYSSFIVLETPEQEQAMRKRQELLMQSASWAEFYESAQNASFEDEEAAEDAVDDDVPSTSEPGLLLCLTLLIPLIAFYRRRTSAFMVNHRWHQD